ncbi:MAG: dihydroxyacetone kinase family protein [Egibacteraceae bacterium]
MTRVYNDPEDFKDEMTAGFLAAYGRYVERVPGASGVMRRGGAREGKVSLITGGGSGHYPAFCGIVGAGLADGAVMGDIFTSPSTQQAYLVAKALDGGAGILFSYGNYAGDVLNFDAAQDRLRDEGIDCRTVLVTDDVASADEDEAHKRRGIAGDLCVFKVAGAAADRGESLDDVERIAQKANDVTRTLGVAFAGCTFPGQSEPLFSVDEGKMELGLGIHGEPGVRTVDAMSAKDLASLLLEPLLEERPEGADGRAAVLLNGLGATKYEELFLLYGNLMPLLEDAGIQVVMPETGELVTSLDMAGCSLTLCWLDDELEELWSAPADTPAFRRGETSALPSFREKGAAAVETGAEAEAVEASPESREAAETVRTALHAMLDAVNEQEDELGRLDAVAGDGDHGVGMTRGFRAATQAADDADGGAGTVLRRAGLAFGDKAGGTSGMLWGSLLEEFGKALGDTEKPTALDVVEATDRAIELVKQLGKASVGDKTMLDAMVPFADELRQQVDDGAGLADAWSTAAETADDAAEGTAELEPKIGRARPLAERSVGTPDPGATSMALCVGAVAQVLRGEST